MQTDNRFLDDLAKLASGAFSSAGAVREEIEARFRQRFEALVAGMNLVRRDEFDAVKAMAAAARAEGETQAARIAALEAEIAHLREQGTARPKRAPGSSSRRPLHDR